MSPRLALALDTICWVCATVVAYVWGPVWLAILVGSVGVIYLSRCVFIMVHIMKAEQILVGYEVNDDVDNDRDY